MDKKKYRITIKTNSDGILTFHTNEYKIVDDGNIIRFYDSRKDIFRRFPLVNVEITEFNEVRDNGQEHTSNAVI